MKLNKFAIVSIVLLAILTFGAVSAADDTAVDNLTVVSDSEDIDISSPNDEIDAGGEILANASAEEVLVSDNAVSKSNERLGASTSSDVLGENYDMIYTPDNIDMDAPHIPTGNLKFVGEFRGTDYYSYLIFDPGCIIDASEATFIDLGVMLTDDVQINGLTLTSTRYLEDGEMGMASGALLYITGSNNIIENMDLTYAPEEGYNVYGVLIEDAQDFQIKNSVITFTGSNLYDYYEYAMKIVGAQGSNLLKGNTITANLPILDVDFSKGDPGLETDLVLNTGIKDSEGIDMINNTFIANVIDRNGGYPTLDCVMIEYSNNLNIINNTLIETDLVTQRGETNYLNVLDMYYSSDVLVKGNTIHVESDGGSEDAGTSYCIQLTGPYENVVIDGNDLYSHCEGPALGVYSQNYYGDTEILVQNNKIDVTGLPTTNSWGLVSGIELQDNVARVYNNDIRTKSITGESGEGLNLYGISYAQALNENHNYDIRGNTIETDGPYTIYLLKAQDTTVVENYLISSEGEGDETVHIQNEQGTTTIENNNGRKNFYVDSYGDDKNPGSEDEPLQSIGRALELVPEGGKIYLLEGTHVLQERIEVSKSFSIIGKNRKTTLVDCNGYDVRAAGVSFEKISFENIGFVNLPSENFIYIDGCEFDQLNFKNCLFDLENPTNIIMLVYGQGNFNFIKNTIQLDSNYNKMGLLVVAGDVQGTIQNNILNSLSAIVSQSNRLVNANMNYWGTNNPLEINNNGLEIENIVMAKSSIDSDEVMPGDEVTVTVDFNNLLNLNNGEIIKQSGLINDDITVTFKANGKFTDNNVAIENGIATTTYTNDVAGTDEIISIIPNQELTNEINIIKLGELEINVTDTWVNYSNNVVATLPVESGSATIKVNGRTVDTVSFSKGKLTYTIKAGDMQIGENTVVVTGDSFNGQKTFKVLDYDGVVTSETFFNYFNASNSYRLCEHVPEGAVLDFQGSFISNDDVSYVMEINKPVNMISTTKNAYIDLDTVAQGMTGENPGDRFTVSFNGSGSNISDISFHNSQLWFFNAHNLNINNLTSIVEDQQIGSGVGVVAFRGGSSHINIKNSYFSTKNNGGSSTFVLTNASYISIDHSSIIGIGNVGNLIYMNFNNMEMPEGVFLPQIIQLINQGKLEINDHNNFTNCYIQGPDDVAPICILVQNMGSGHNVFENNTFVYGGSTLNSGTYSIVRNNTLIGGCSITAGKDSVVVDNKVDAGVSIASNTEFTDNAINGTLTVKGNGNTITENYINSTGNYAVDLGSTTGNTVNENFLYSKDKLGNSAITGTGSNNIGVNRPLYDIQVTVSEDNIWLGSDNAVEVFINGANGKVAIKVNDKIIAEPSLTNNRVTQTISAADIKAGANKVEVTYDGESESATFNVYGLVTNETYSLYFNESNSGRLSDFVPAGATLDFQGKFLSSVDQPYVMEINKPVNIISSTKDAYIDLNTTAGTLMGENPGNRFTVSNGGSGSNISDLYFHNSQIWVFNAHNVILDHISNVIEDKQVGSGVGATSIRANSTYVTVKNSYFYTKNNGGSSSLVMAWADYCTFENNTVEVEGRVGNLIYSTNFNVDVPEGVVANQHNTFRGNTIHRLDDIYDSICWGIVVSGPYNLVENNTVIMTGGNGITVQWGGNDKGSDSIYRGNKVYGCSINALPNSELYDNYVEGGSINVASGSEAYNNTVVGGSLTLDSAVGYDNNAEKLVLKGESEIKGSVVDVDIAKSANVKNLTVTGTLRFVGDNAVVSNSTINNVLFGVDKNTKSSGSKLVNSTITGDITFTYMSNKNSLTGNNISKTVVLNSAQNIVSDNNIITSANYAVDSTYNLANKNTISNNYLISNGKKGNGAVTVKTGKNHVVENNGPDLTLGNLENVWVSNDQTITVNILPTFKNTTLTIKVNGKVINETTAKGEFTQVVKYADLRSGVNTVEVTAEGITKTGTFTLFGVITKDNIFEYFDQSNGGVLFDFVPEGATLDFQGEIKATEIGNFNITISKPVNVISSTKDSYIDLNTSSGGDLLGQHPGDRFTVNNGGSGSNITGIYIHNTQVWISNTTNVVFDGVSAVVENQLVGSGVGTVSVRDNSSYVTIKNGYFYTENNGGSSTLVMAWANHCTFDNNTVTGKGHIGNMIYSTNYNVYTAPKGYEVSNDYNVIKNNNISNPDGGTGICRSITIFGSHNIIDNNTINKGSGFFTQWGTGESKRNNTYSNNRAYDIQYFEVFPNSTIYNNYVVITKTASTQADSIAYNNTIVGTFSVGTGSIVYNNSVTSKLSAYGAGTVVYDNIAETLELSNGAIGHDNKISGSITVKANSKAYNEHVETLIVDGENATVYNNTVKTLTVGGVNAKAYNNTIGSPSGSLGAVQSSSPKDDILGVSLRDIYGASNGDGVLTVNSGAIVYDNIVYGQTIIDGEGIEVYESTLNGDVSVSQSSTDVKLHGNEISGTVNVDGSNNEIVDNQITSTDDYAIILGNSENNVVTGNTLYSSNKKGNAAISSSSSENTVGENYPVDYSIIYVSETGLDTNDGTTRDAAVASLTKAVELVVDNGKIIFLNGTYTIASQVIINKNLTIFGENNVTLISLPANALMNYATLNLNNLIVKDSTGIGRLFINMNANMTINHCEFSNNVATLIMSGIIQNIGGLLIVNDTKFINNVVGLGSVWTATTGSVLINNSLFKSNSIGDLRNARSSAVNMASTGNLIIENTVFDSNDNQNADIDIFSNALQVNLTKCTFIEGDSEKGTLLYVGASSDVNVKESTFIYSGNNGNSIVVNNGSLDISDSVILQDTGYAIVKADGATVTANDNWWGDNTKANTEIPVDRWVIMSVTPESATADDEVTIVVNFDKTNSTAGVIADYAGNLPDGFNVTFTSTSSGLDEVKAVKNHQASVTYTPTRTDEELTVTSSNVVVEIPIEIRQIIVYVSETGDDNRYGEIRENAVASLNRAYDLVAENGKIIFLNGTYTLESSKRITIERDLDISGEGNVTIHFIFNDNYNGDSIIRNNAKLNLSNLKFKDSNCDGMMIVNSFNGILNISNCEFVNNSAKWESLLSFCSLISNVGVLSVENTRFINNTLIMGCIYNIDNKNAIGNLTVKNSEFKNNRIPEVGVSSTINIYWGENILIENCVFENNTNEEAAISIKKSNIGIDYNPKVNIINCSFIENPLHYNPNSNVDCNAISISNGIATIKESTFISFGDEGTLIYFYGESLDISDCVILQENGSPIAKNKATVTANDNWWGSNDKPVIDGVTIDRWVIMSVTPDKATADEEVTITATFDKTNSTAGVIADYAGNLPADVLNVTFTSTSGNLNEVKAVKDKQASVTYTPARTDEKLTVTSTNAVVEIPVELIVPDIFIDVEKTGMWLNEANSVTVTIPEGTGTISIKVNGKEIATPELSEGSATQSIEISDMIDGVNTVEVTYDGFTNSTTFTAQGNVVTAENFNKFFTDGGEIKEDMPFDELIFKGEFDALADYLIIEQPISITGDNAVLNNMGVYIASDDVKLDKLNFTADTSLGSLITVEGSNVDLTNLDINYSAGEEEGVAVDIMECSDVHLLNSTIFFESHVPDDTVKAIAVQAVNTQNVLVDGNNITTKLPCVYVNTYDEDYYMMGSNNVNPVRLKDCSNLVFTNNNINSTTNNCTASFPTIQSIYIIGCSDSLIDHNNISMIDKMTPSGMDNYMYGINFGHNSNVTFSYNNFEMFTSGGKDAAGTNYAFQGVESEVIIKGNNITSKSYGPNLGIYVASMFGGDSKLLIEDNFINVTGYASPSGSWALVSGIEIQNGEAKIYNNTIYTYNVNEYNDNSYMYGISYAQWMYGTRGFDIQNNTIYTEGKYTISVIDADHLYAGNNTLYAHDLAGDDSINAGKCKDVVLEANLPPKADINITVDKSWLGDDNDVLINISNANENGRITIKVNDKVLVTDAELTGGIYLYTIKASDLKSGKNNITVSYAGDSDILDNVVSELFDVIDNVVTQDNFYTYFNDNGNLLSDVPFDELVFKGEFEDLVSYITLERAIKITGEDAVLNNIGFILAGDKIVIDNLKLVADEDMGNLIDIAGEDVVISNNNISYVVTEAANAINVNPYANDAQILNNTIYFESTVEEYASDEETNAICVNSGMSFIDDEADPITGLVISGNNITAVIPAFLADLYEHEYMVMGLSAVNGVRINGAEDFEFTNNNLDVSTNYLDRTTPTYQALYVASSTGLIDGNNISMIDTFTPEGKDVYLYAIEVIHDEDLTISNNNFNISTKGGKASAGAAYAIQAVDSTIDMIKNNITTVSNGPNLAVYLPSRFGSPCDLTMTGNFINVTGLASNSDNNGLVSGIEVQTGDVVIKENIIYTQNIGEYDKDNYIYGISYVQDGSDSDFEITDNEIHTDGYYTISLKSAASATITDNCLIGAGELYGDDSVTIKSGSGYTIKDNYPCNLNLTVEAENITVGEDAEIVIKYNESATGNIKVIVNGEIYDVENGKNSVIVPGLTAGEHVAKVIFESNDKKFASDEKTLVLNVSKKDSEMNITFDSDVKVGDDVEIAVELPENATGEVIVVVDGEEHKVPVDQGSAKYTVENITSGNHSIVVMYPGDKNYAFAYNATKLTVDKLASEVNVTVTAGKAGEKSLIKVNVTDGATGTVIIDVNGTKYTIDLAETTELEVVLDAGSYPVVATYSGDDKYDGNASEMKTLVVADKAGANVKVEIPTDVKVGDEIVINVTADTTEDLTVKIDGDDYTVEDGKVKFTPATSGLHNITVTAGENGEFKAVNETVNFVADKKDAVLEIAPVDAKVGDKVTIKVVNETDRALTIKVNGETVTGEYEITKAGKYIVTVESAESAAYNAGFATYTFTVEKLQSEVNVTATAGKAGEKSLIKVNVTDGAAGTVIIDVNCTKYIIDLAETTELEVVLDAGSYPVVATYSGDDKYDDDVSDEQTLVVADKLAANIKVEILDDVKVGDRIIINVSADTTADLTVTINGVTQEIVSGNGLLGVFLGDLLRAIENGKVVFTVPSAGVYNVTVTAKENGEYLGQTVTKIFEVTKKDAVLNITSITEAKVGDKVTIKVVNETDGALTIKVNGDDVTGEYEITKVGTYIVTVESASTDAYNKGFATYKFEVAGSENITIVIDGVEYNITPVNGTTVKTNMSDELEKAKQNITNLTEQLEDAKANATKLSDELADAKANATKLSDELADANAKVDNLTGQLEDANAKVDNLTDELADANAKVDNLTGQLEDAKAKVDNLTDELSDANDKIADLTRQLEEALANKTKTVVVDGVEYPIEYVNGTAVVNTNKTEPAKEDSNATITTPSDVKAGENANVDVVIPNATGNVFVIVDGKETVVPLVNGSASVPLENVSAGDHSVVVIYSGDETHAPTHSASSFSVAEEAVVEPIATEFVDIVVFNDSSVSATLVDEAGNAIANATVSYTVGGVSGSAVTDSNGLFTIKGETGVLVTMIYAGDDKYLATNTSIKFDNAAPAVKDNTSILAEDFTQYACDFYEGERGENFTFQLVDANGNPVANRTIFIGYNGVTLNRTTDAKGFASVQINLKNAGLYTFVIVFLGDEDYNASMAVHKVVIKKKTTSISASAKTFKATAKTKKYTVTLKTIVGASIDGKTYLEAGKKVTLKINGKTYTAKTNAKGQVTFNLKLTKKGKFTAEIKYSGDETYKASSKKAKITIK